MTVTDFSFSHEDDQQRYLARADGQFAGEITYHLVKPGVIAIDHTGTEPAFRGQGLAGRLTEFALDDIAQRGLKVVPNCPYTANYIDQRPELGSLLA